MKTGDKVVAKDHVLASKINEPTEVVVCLFGFVKLKGHNKIYRSRYLVPKDKYVDPRNT